MGQKSSTIIIQLIQDGSIEQAVEVMYADNRLQRIAHARFKNYERTLAPSYNWEDIFHEALVKFTQQVVKGADVVYIEQYFGSICQNICFKLVEKMAGRHKKRRDTEGGKNEDLGNENGTPLSAAGNTAKPTPPTFVEITDADGKNTNNDDNVQMVIMLEWARNQMKLLDKRDQDLLSLRYFKTPLAENTDIDKQESRRIEIQKVAQKWHISPDAVPVLANRAQKKWVEMMGKNRQELETIKGYSLDLWQLLADD